jgi:hypothetical protein
MKATRIIVLALAVLAMCGVGQAQMYLNSSTAQTTLTYSQPETVTVSVDTASLALAPTLAAEARGGLINVTTTWNLASTRTGIQTLFGLGSTTAALTGTAGNIPSSDILATGNGGEVPCTASGVGNLSGFQGVPGAMCAAAFYNGALSNFNSTNSSPVYIRLLPTAVIPYGTYSGTLYFATWVM